VSRPTSEARVAGAVGCPVVHLSMTRMARRSPRYGAANARNYQEYNSRSPLARFVLICAAAVVLPSFACAVPPSLQLDQPDAGENAAPIVTSVSNAAAEELIEPGPITVAQGAGTLSVTLRDADVGDALFVRMFVDYNRPDPTPPRVLCSTASGTTVKRTASCPITGLCQTSDIGQERNLWIEVFDRQPLETGLPLYRAMPTGGASSKWQFTMRCQERQ
jgi:hypothetical protein